MATPANTTTDRQTAAALRWIAALPHADQWRYESWPTPIAQWLASANEQQLMTTIVDAVSALKRHWRDV